MIKQYLVFARHLIRLEKKDSWSWRVHASDKVGGAEGVRATSWNDPLNVSVDKQRK